MDIVLQGPIWPTTIQTAMYYLELSFVDNVIISTWDDESIEEKDIIDIPGIKLVKSSKEGIKEINEISNVNLQIISSFAGIKITTSDIVAKMRTDQIIHKDDMIMWNDFITKDIHNTDLTYTDGTKRKGNVYVIGLNKIHSFHPQDHIFWGYREDIYRIFNIPPKPKHITSEAGEFRCPAYIGSMYFKQFYPEVETYLNNWKEYLCDNPSKQNAKILSKKTRDKVFKVLPKVCINWVKYECFNYQYPHGMYANEGDYYYEDLI